MTRRQFVAAAGAAAAAAFGQNRRPNIIWIMADDLGVGDLGCYGQKKIRTPNIDRIAAEGMRFTSAYAGCTVCAPSRSVLMTGMHMGHTSVRANSGGVPLLPSDYTVAEMLKAAGYKTGLFGKWGLGDIKTDSTPDKQGFDEYCGYLHQLHAHWFYTDFLYKNGKRLPLPGNEGGKRVTYSHDVIAKESLGFIERHKEGPFFAYLPFTIPHLELLVPKDSFSDYEGKFPEKPYIDKRKHYADQPNRRATYAAMVTRMDRDVGKVLDTLKRLGIEKDTVVFFTSDNGAATRLWGEDFFESTAGLRGHKQNFYEGGIRTPLLARWPGRIKAGSTTPNPFVFYDFMATAAELSGAKLSSRTDGISFVPTLLGGKQKLHDYLYWELPRFNAKEGRFIDTLPTQALRAGDWKVVRPKAEGPLELYNLKDDPRETKDLAAAQPKELARLEKLLLAARTPPRAQSEPDSDEWGKRSTPYAVSSSGN